MYEIIKMQTRPRDLTGNHTNVTEFVELANTLLKTWLFTWNILKSKSEYCLPLIRNDLLRKYDIIRSEYKDRPMRKKDFWDSYLDFGDLAVDYLQSEEGVDVYS